MKDTNTSSNWGCKAKLAPLDFIARLAGLVPGPRKKQWGQIYINVNFTDRHLSK